MAAAILRDELEGLATGSRGAIDVEARDEVDAESYR